MPSKKKPTVTKQETDQGNVDEVQAVEKEVKAKWAEVKNPVQVAYEESPKILQDHINNLNQQLQRAQLDNIAYSNTIDVLLTKIRR